ncbi:MAG TPA: hypothetical protein DCF44_02585 [Chitinophagaceae bacterium]|nr:hypothetical protein [Chitinophagaceae bacterium]
MTIEEQLAIAAFISKLKEKRTLLNKKEITKFKKATCVKLAIQLSLKGLLMGGTKKASTN